MSPARTLPPTARAVLTAVGATCLSLLLAWSWIGATHSPAPHAVPVGVVGPAAAEAGLGAALDARAPGGFDLVAYPTAQQAAAALGHDDLAAAVVITPPATPAAAPGLELLTASAEGVAPAQVLTQTFEAAAAAQHAAFRTVDVAPLPANDRLGASGFLLVLATLIPCLAVGAALGLTGRALGRIRLGLLVTAFAVLIAGADTLLAVAGLGALAGHGPAAAGLLGLFALAVSLPLAAATRRFGVKVLPPAALVLLGIGVPATGLPAGINYFTPAFYHRISAAVPNSAAVNGLRDAVYFGGTHLTGDLVGLCCWVAAGLVLLTLPLRRRAAAAAGSGPAPAVETAPVAPAR
jgi:hypothetical protein